MVVNGISEPSTVCYRSTLVTIPKKGQGLTRWSVFWMFLFDAWIVCWMLGLKVKRNIPVIWNSIYPKEISQLFECFKENILGILSWWFTSFFWTETKCYLKTLRTVFTDFRLYNDQLRFQSTTSKMQWGWSHEDGWCRSNKKTSEIKLLS